MNVESAKNVTIPGPNDSSSRLAKKTEYVGPELDALAVGLRENEKRTNVQESKSTLFAASPVDDPRDVVALWLEQDIS